MTVKELIEELKKLPPDALVSFRTDFCYTPNKDELGFIRLPAET